MCKIKSTNKINYYNIKIKFKYEAFFDALDTFYHCLSRLWGKFKI